MTGKLSFLRSPWNEKINGNEPYGEGRNMKTIQNIAEFCQMEIAQENEMIEEMRAEGQTNNHMYTASLAVKDVMVRLIDFIEEKE